MAVDDRKGVRKVSRQLIPQVDQVLFRPFDGRMETLHLVLNPVDTYAVPGTSPGFPAENQSPAHYNAR
ncbi:MAG: hypothetical protein Kow0089_04780 [Desulfobulbaceae bacterium]